ncbi:lectin subunit alpha-like [Musca autumnalis]|uniref:lectin subunit alpha-like n=1 Tax=Musca autumnalis TaxID=221902 RepID=UPI003CF9306F
MFHLKYLQKFLFLAIFIALILEKSFATEAGTTAATNVTNGYYIERSDKGNWFQAFNRCSTKHMNLVVLDSKAKMDALIRELKKVFGSDHPNIWIGGNDNKKIRQFMWISANKPFTYTNWAPGQPDNKNSVEHCVMLWENHNYHWNDGNCLSKMAYVCEERK